MKNVKVLAVAIALAVFSLSPVASAVEYGGVGGTPANPRADNPRSKSIFVYTLKSGQPQSDGIKIYNNTQEKRTISVNAVDSVLASGGAFSCAQQADPRVDVGKWIQLKSNQITLDPHTNQTVPFTVTPPENAGAGEHDGCITIQDASMTEASTAKNGVVLGFRSAIRVAVTVPGNIVKELSLQSVTVAMQKDGTYQVITTARNNGNVSLDTNLKVKLTSVFGLAANQNKATYPILANSSARWETSLSALSWGGWYKATTTATYSSNPGASLGEKSANQKTVELSSGLFYVPPTGIAALIEILAVLLVIGAIVWFVRRLQHKRHVNKHWDIYVVEAHETLNHIAKEHGVSWKKIARVNKLKPPYHIEKGQKLRLPPPPEE
jgi:hypothetical protein